MYKLIIQCLFMFWWIRFRSTLNFKIGLLVEQQFCDKRCAPKLEAIVFTCSGSIYSKLSIINIH